MSTPEVFRNRAKPPLPVEHGGTGEVALPDIVDTLNVPTLDGTNQFTGENRFDGTTRFRLSGPYMPSGSQLTEGVTATRTWELPDASGTLALTSDITGGLSDGDYGDVTVGGSGTTMTVDQAACPKIVGTYSATLSGDTVQTVLASAPVGLYRMTVGYHINIIGDPCGFTRFGVFLENAGEGVEGFLSGATSAASSIVKGPTGSSPLWDGTVMPFYVATSDNIQFELAGWTGGDDTVDVRVVLERLL